MSHNDTAPFGPAFLGPKLTHLSALADRLPGVPLSACEGVLVFRRHAHPSYASSPQIHRCAACGAVVCLDPRGTTVLWIEAFEVNRVEIDPS